MNSPWDKMRNALQKWPKHLEKMAERANAWELGTKWLWNINFFAPYLYSYLLLWPLEQLNMYVWNISGADSTYSIFIALYQIGFYGLLAANAFGAFRFRKKRFWFIGFILLNSFAYFFLADLAFATGLFNLNMWVHLLSPLYA